MEIMNMLKTVRRTSTLASVATVIGAFALITSKAGVVYDNISNEQQGVTGAYVTATTTTPNTFMGGAYLLAPGTTEITGLDMFPVDLAGSYTGLKLTVDVWAVVNLGTVSAAAPAFGDELGSYTFNETGTYASGHFYGFVGTPNGTNPCFVLPAPLAIPSILMALTFSYQATTDGTNYQTVNNLDSLISFGLRPSVGRNPFTGFYQNFASETNGNFVSPQTMLGPANENLTVRIFGDSNPVPEPTTLALTGAGGLALFVLRRIRMSADRRVR